MKKLFEVLQEEVKERQVEEKIEVGKVLKDTLEKYLRVKGLIDAPLEGGELKRSAEVRAPYWTYTSGGKVVVLYTDGRIFVDGKEVV
jgi:hypothetical protein